MRVGSPKLVRLAAGCCVAATLSACKSDKMVAPPNTAKPCGSGSTVQLSTLQAATVPCSAGTTVTLQGGGASYLVVPQFATGFAVNRATSYTIGIAGGTSANVVVNNGPSLDVLPEPTGRLAPPRSVVRRARQRAFDAMLRDDARQKVASGAWGGIGRQLSPGAG